MSDLSIGLRYAMLIAFGTSMIASVLRIYRLYLQQNASSYDSGAPRMLSIRFHRLFLVLVTGQIAVSLGTGVGFVIATSIDANRWSVHLLSSVVLSSMVGQCLWAGGTWFQGQQAFRPLRLAAGLVICTTAFVAGVLLGSKKATVGTIILSVFAIVFRAGMTIEWAVFFSEKRLHVPASSLNRKIAGHLLIQTFATLGIMVTCILGGAYAKSMDLIPSLRLIMLVIISAVYGLNDLFTEGWLMINHWSCAWWLWERLDSNASLNDVELRCRG